MGSEKGGRMENMVIPEDSLSREKISIHNEQTRSITT